MAVKITVEAKAIKAPELAPIKRACLGGGDIARMLKGEVIKAYGVEFVYDGTDQSPVLQAAEDLNKSLTHGQKHDKRKGT